MYVDGYVLLVPKKKLPAYKKLATLAAKIWMEHGAVQFCETAGDDLNQKFGRSFPKIAKPKRGETVVFSWIMFKSKKHRDSVNAKVMKDKRLANMGPDNMPFDHTRMSYGGFKPLVLKGKNK